MSKDKKRPILFNRLLMIASIVGTLLITELVFRLVLPQNLVGSWYISTDNGLLVNKSSGTAKQQHGDRIVRYSFYEPNFRGTPIRDNGIKILVLGDSFTFGFLLEEEDTYVYHLQQYTDKNFGKGAFQYLNASVGGWGTADYVAYVEDFGNIVKPDIILVFINGADISRSVNSILREENLYTLSDESKLMLNRHRVKSSKLKNIVNSIPCYQWFIENSHLVQFARVRMLTKQDKSNRKIRRKPEQKLSHFESKMSHNKDKKQLKQKLSTIESKVSLNKGSALGKALFKRLKTWCDNNHTSLYVTTTGYFNIKHLLGNTSEFFQSIDVPFLDIRYAIYGKLKKDESGFIIRGDGHPNEKGSKLIADMSWKLFIKKQLHEYYHAKENNKSTNFTTYQNNK
ncbi:MAG: SGNH/GDSL hydrolase family protein [Candidatus Brocadiaceae bacterium]|nr:SGNH/GDSL hydrolase family protein [Candidatus Brocadiaceae bacterium]